MLSETTDRERKKSGGNNGNQTRELYIECPFYVRQKQNRIVCEGMKDCDTATHLFIDTKKRNKWIKEVCSVDGGRGCPFYKCIIEKYEEGEEND